MRRIVISGANGFLGRNLVNHLNRIQGFEPVPLTRRDEPNRWRDAIESADGMVHLAGVTQSNDWNEMYNGNVRPAQLIADVIQTSISYVPIAYASTVKVVCDTPYGRTKKIAEEILVASARSRSLPIAVFRLPHVFGPLARTQHNSIVVTMCAEHAWGRPLSFCNPDGILEIVFVDDVVQAFVKALVEVSAHPVYPPIVPLFRTSVGEVAETIRSFEPSLSYKPSVLDPLLITALRRTYRSFLPS